MCYSLLGLLCLDCLIGRSITLRLPVLIILKSLLRGTKTRWRQSSVCTNNTFHFWFVLIGCKKVEVEKNNRNNICPALDQTVTKNDLILNENEKKCKQNLLCSSAAQDGHICCCLQKSPLAPFELDTEISRRKTITYFVRGRITVHLTSSLTDLDFTEQVNLLLI